MRVHILGSGSRGNAIVLESHGSAVLIDAGFGTRTLAGRLAQVGVSPGSISALVVTHEHLDHIGGATAAARRWHWPVFATAGTLHHLAPRRGIATNTVGSRNEFSLGDLSLRFVRTPHDATESIAIVATSRLSGARVGVVYDLGHITARLASYFADLDALLLESNYDLEMLRVGPYPRFLQDRIAGPQGHLSNADAAAMARGCVHRGLRHLILCHLSERNNRPDVALRTMRGALRGSGFRGTLQAAGQDTTLSVGLGRSSGGVQLSLGL